jgi:hypothetical protein
MADSFGQYSVKEKLQRNTNNKKIFSLADETTLGITLAELYFRTCYRKRGGVASNLAAR